MRVVAVGLCCGSKWVGGHCSPVPVDAATLGARCRCTHQSTGVRDAVLCPFPAVTCTHRLPRAQPQGWNTSYPGAQPSWESGAIKITAKNLGALQWPCVDGAAVPHTSCPGWLYRWLSSAERKHVAGETGLYLYYIPYVHLVCLITFKTAEKSEHHIHFKAE